MSNISNEQLPAYLLLSLFIIFICITVSALVATNIFNIPFWTCCGIVAISIGVVLILQVLVALFKD